MSLRAMTAVDELPGDAFTITGTRYVLYKLADAANDQDESQPCIVEIEWLMARTSQANSTVRRHLDTLETDGWIRRERIVNGDGTLGAYRFYLCLEKLGLRKVHRSDRAVAAGGVDNAAGPAPDPSTPAPNLGQPPLDPSQPPLILGGHKEELLPSFPSSFIFQDDEERDLMVRALAVCGPGLADPKANPSVLASLRRVLASWTRAYDFELDILPVLRAQTLKVRPAAKMLTGFEVLLPDLRKHRTARLPGPNAPQRGLPPDEELLAKLQSDESRVRLGKSPLFSRVEGETVDEAGRRIAAEIEATQDRLRAGRKATESA